MHHNTQRIWCIKKFCSAAGVNGCDKKTSCREYSDVSLMLFCFRMRRCLGLSHDRLEIRCGCVDSKPLWNSRMGLSLGFLFSTFLCFDRWRKPSEVFLGGSWEIPIGWKSTSAEGDVYWDTTQIWQPNKPTELVWRRKSIVNNRWQSNVLHVHITISYYVTTTASSRILPHCRMVEKCSDLYVLLQ